MVASRFSSLLIKGAVLSIGAVLYFSGSAHAAMVTVTTTDMTSLPGECTLRDAIDAANTNMSVNGCPAGDPLPTVDTISLPAGTYAPETDTNLGIDESVVIRGLNSESTILDGILFNTNDLSGRLEFRHLSLRTSELSANSSSAILYLTLDHVLLDGTYLWLGQYGSGSLESTITNVRAVNNSAVSLSSDTSQPGDTLIRFSEFDGDGSTGPFLIHDNQRANDRVEIQNSTITNYAIGVINHECSPSYQILSLFITDSMIGGGNMRNGVVNSCGHLVVRGSTFHDITGAAIVAFANYQSRHDVVCYEVQGSSRIEIYNSSFSRITVVGDYEPYTWPLTPLEPRPYTGIIDIDSRLQSGCGSASQATDTDITLVHVTFAGNTFTNAGSAAVGATDGTVLRDFRLRNNAFQGQALRGSFSASGSVEVANNLTTEAYSGPAAFASGFKTVDDFLLGPLQDNGGALIGVDQTGGRVLTMRPLAGSPLIDAAPSAGLTDDQRGTARSLMARYDVGAVEVTLAEFTADGGVYTPETDTPDRLAETGSDRYLTIIVSLGLALGGIKLAAIGAKRP